jgi:hypothetical protein
MYWLSVLQMYRASALASWFYTDNKRMVSKQKQLRLSTRSGKYLDEVAVDLVTIKVGVVGVTVGVVHS